MDIILTLLSAVATATVFIIVNSFLAGRKYAEMATKADLTADSLKPVVQEVLREFITESIELESRYVTVEQCKTLRREVKAELSGDSERMAANIGQRVLQVMTEVAGMKEILTEIKEGMIRREEAELRNSQHRLEMEAEREKTALERREREQEATNQILVAIKAINREIDKLKERTSDHDGWIRAKKNERNTP